MQLNHQIKQYERKGDDLIPDETFANRLLILEQKFTSHLRWPEKDVAPKQSKLYAVDVTHTWLNGS